MGQRDELIKKGYLTSCGTEREKSEVSLGGLSSSLSGAQAAVGLKPKSFLLWASVSHLGNGGHRTCLLRINSGKIPFRHSSSIILV